MTETKFTPGPWVRDCWDIMGRADLYSGTGVVCEVASPNGDDDKYWRPGEADANATLIAAAPDLYETLRRLERWFDTDPEVLDAMSKDERADHERQLAMIRAALAKARWEDKR